MSVESTLPDDLASMGMEKVKFYMNDTPWLCEALGYLDLELRF